MKAGYRAVERALARARRRRAPRRAQPAARSTRSTGRPCSAAATPCRRVLELQERFGGRRVLITGGGGSIGGRAGHAAARLPARARDAARLPRGVADRRPARAQRARSSSAMRARARATSATAAGSPRRSRARGPTSIFHLAAYKHVDWAETLPGGVRRHEPAGQLERAARGRGVRRRTRSSSPRPTRPRWPRASTGARSASWSSSPPTRRARAAAHRCAVRLVNVLGSAGSASELFLRQARAGVPLTVTDTGMMRFWITRRARRARARPRRAAGRRRRGARRPPHDPAELSVGELAERIWRAAGAGETADIELLGIRRGETLTEVLTGPGRDARRRGAPGHRGDHRRRRRPPGPAWVAERLEASMGREEARAVWLEAMRRPGPARPGRAEPDSNPPHRRSVRGNPTAARRAGL